MVQLELTVVTAERTLLSESVDFVSALGPQGRLGILPNHAPLLTTLEPGALYYRRGGEEARFACSGGFMEVAENRVIVLADTAERADEIDEARAEEARRRAEALLRDKDKLSRDELFRAEASLRKAMVRLRVARYRRQRPMRPPQRVEEEGSGGVE
jgi:F-type H+-transporting ATPase subunit epsilon